MLSIVMPTLNAMPSLKGALGSLQNEEAHEILVSDGGSVDDTIQTAQNFGAKIVTSNPGRGNQLAAGAAATGGDWLLFIHADSRLSENWVDAVSAFTMSPENAGKAAYFGLRFDDQQSGARRIERMVAWRSRTLGLPYGDQGLLIHRAFYDQIGGYRPMPLMEDVDLVRRIGKRRLVALDAEITTSAARYQRDGWWFRPVRNLLCLALYFCRVPPRIIARIYV